MAITKPYVEHVCAKLSTGRGFARVWAASFVAYVQ